MGAQSAAGARRGDHNIQVLDHGFVRLVEFSGGDEAVLRTARGRMAEGANEEERRGRLSEVLASGVSVPLRAARFTFNVKCPFFVAAYLFPGVGHAFAETHGDVYLPDEDALGPLAPDAPPDSARLARDMIESAYKVSVGTFRRLVAAGVAPSRACIVLPRAAYTEFYFPTDAFTLLDIFRAAGAAGAPPEALPYVAALREIFAARMPLTGAAFESAPARPPG